MSILQSTVFDMSHSVERIKVLIAGVCGLILMLGVARFAYTPILPLMQAQTGLSHSEGAWLASINYLGYLFGALIAASISNMVLKDRLYRVGIVLALLTTIAMAMTTDWRLWAVLRLFAGLSSAAGLLLGSGLVLNWLIRHHFRSELGIHFAGIGVGILFSALAVELMSPNFDWQEQWLWLSAFGLVLAIPAWAWLPRPGNSGYTISGQPLEDRPPTQLFLSIFMVAYFCAGVGYVVSATFIVAIVDQQPGLEGKGNWVFLLIGLAAAPACVLWDRVARRIGDLNSLIIAGLLQVLGIALPLISETLAGAIMSAVLFGSTFIGIVSLVLTMAGRFYPSYPSKMMGKMTFSYSMAQMLSPAVIALIADAKGGYRHGLYLASSAMVISTTLMVLLRTMHVFHSESILSTQTEN